MLSLIHISAAAKPAAPAAAMATSAKPAAGMEDKTAKKETCRNDKGKFTKCDSPAAAKKKAPCRDAKGKFIKCA